LSPEQKAGGRSCYNSPMIPDYIDRTLIPHKPGIYIYHDKDGEILYVGKAIDLYHRVSSYFSGSVNSFKTHQMVERIRSVETIIVQSEMEALILEANLIKKYMPPYNIMLKDDKDYIYIGITDEEFPKVISVRKQDLAKVKKYFGPFPSATTVKNTLRTLRRVFPWCSNPPGPRNKNRRPCFYFHIKLCSGPCVGIADKEDYGRIIKMFSQFMEGKHQELIGDLTEQMEEKSKNLEFEEAARIKKLITSIQYLLSPTSISQYLENPNFLEDQNKKALLELQKVLNLPEYPERIECYDISNFQGTDATGSMVILTNGEIDKSQYRKFKISISGKPNDFAMHAEMMRRRIKHKEWPYPQLILIDGGRGQVRAVANVIASFQAKQSQFSNAPSPLPSPLKGEGDQGKNARSIPIYGIAKREEWLYSPGEEIIKLPKRSLALRLVQKIRDESHRFAITYHRKLRAKSFGIGNR
jgi:excinuclease ABC subunit C